MSLPRARSLAAIATFAVLFGSPLARADVPPDAQAGARSEGGTRMTEVGDAGASDTKDGTSVGGGGCGIGASAPLEPLGIVVAGAALFAASRRRRSR